jgi:hypothetical protein
MVFPPEKALRRVGLRQGEETGDRRLFDDAAAVDENDFVGHAPRLAEVVGGHQDACAAGGYLADDALDLALLPGSRLAVGSSRISSSGSSAQARASATRCCSPPDSSRAGRAARCGRPTRSSAAAARRSLSLRAGP